jgi:hypothetical protein
MSDAPHDSALPVLPPADRGARHALRGLRMAFVAVGLVLWFWTQSLIGSRTFPPGEIGDMVHVWTAPLHSYLVSHPAVANGLLIVSSAGIDAVGMFLIGRAVFGTSLRPFLSLMLIFILRQACQGVCGLPAPEGMIWRHPGVPSLLVTYGVASDFFFSGHTGLAVLGAIELARLGRPWLTAVGVLLALFEASTVLVLRAHYTMDVFAGAVTALLVSTVAERLAPHCDRALAALVRKGSSGT